MVCKVKSSRRGRKLALSAPDQRGLHLRLGTCLGTRSRGHTCKMPGRGEGGRGQQARSNTCKTNIAECWVYVVGKHASGPRHGTRRSHISQNSVAARSRRVWGHAWVVGHVPAPTHPRGLIYLMGEQIMGGSLHLTMIVRACSSHRRSITTELNEAQGSRAAIVKPPRAV